MRIWCNAHCLGIWELLKDAGANQGAEFPRACKEPLRIVGIPLMLRWVLSGTCGKLGAHFTLLPLGKCIFELPGLGGE